MPSTAAGLRQAINAAPASSALICTLRSLSAARAMMDGKSVMRYGSTQSFFSALAHLQMSVTVIIAASLESLASAAFAMAVATALADALSVCSRRVFAAQPERMGMKDRETPRLVASPCSIMSVR